MYPIKDPPQSDELEATIEKLRKVMRFEESKKLEELRSQALSKRKQQEVRDKRKKDETISYDVGGHVVEVQQMTKLPEIVPHCAPIHVAAPSGGDSSPMRSTARFLRKHLLSKGAANESSDESRLLKEERRRPIVSGQEERTGAPLRGMYDAFVPAEGVTFSELGRNVKAGTVSLKAKLGKISRTEFLTLMSESSLHNNTTGFAHMLQNHRSINSSKVLGGTMEQSQPQPTEFSSSTATFARTVPKLGLTARGVEVSGDLGQLLVKEAENHFRITSGPLSFRPAPYVALHMASARRDKRSRENITNGKRSAESGEWAKNDVDLFNMNMTGGFGMMATGPGRSMPIQLGGRATKRQLRGSLGTSMLGERV